MNIIRVFVSSTFKDMFEEREILSKKVFPELREICQQRGIEFIDIDLRWGITDEMIAEGKVLPVCLHEIDRSRPYFIGLLGERYGFVPDTLPKIILNSYDWIQLTKNRSITELEILHGALLRPEFAKNAFFYFRNPNYSNYVKDKDKAKYVELNQSSAKKLEQLKSAIRKSLLFLRENYPNPEVLGNWIFEDLKKAIDKEFPSENKLSFIEHAEISQHIFANKHITTYIDNPSWLKKIDQYITNGGRPLIVIGDGGMGKSALISNWISHHKNNNFGLPVISHYFEASPEASEFNFVMVRILAELIQKCKLSREIPVTKDPFEIRFEFLKTLNTVSEKGGAILILEGIDHLKNISSVKDFSWLPLVIPENIRIVITMTNETFQDEFSGNDWQILCLTPWSGDDKENLIKKYFSRYSKILTKEQLNELLIGKITNNPRYLITILEELRIFGDFERLDHCIGKYSSCEEPLELYCYILDRWGSDYTVNGRDLVSEFLRLLWASKNGLSENEVAQLLGSENKPCPMGYLSPIFRASEYVLNQCSGIKYGSREPLIRILNPIFLQAVENKYLSDRETKNKTHLKLANFFNIQKLSFRGYQELLYQYIESEDWESLFKLLNQHSFLIQSWNYDSAEIKKAWICLETKSNYKAEETYSDIISNSHNYNIVIVKLIAYLLMDIGSMAKSIHLLKYIVTSLREKNNTTELIKELSNLGVALWRTGYHKDAIVIYREQEELCRENGDKSNLADCLGNLGNVLHAVGQLKDSLSCHLEEGKLCEELKDYEGLQACYGNQSLVLYDLGNSKDAFLCAQRQEYIGRTIYNDDAIAKSIGHQARILYESGDLNKAYELRKKEEEIYRNLGDRINLSVSLGNQALIENSLGNKRKALDLHEEEERLCRMTQNKRGLQYSLGNQAIVYAQLGQFKKAELLFKEQEHICSELGDPKGLIHCLYNRSVMLNEDMGRSLDALDLLECANKLASDHSYASLMSKISALIKTIRSKLS